MSVSYQQLAFYALTMCGLWAVPGPVWVALVARALSGGFRASWPLAVGVALGDAMWPLCAVLGLSWVLSVYGDLLIVMRWIAALVFVVMGGMLLRSSGQLGGADGRLTRPGIWAGFTVGVATIIGNPKAILFYMGFLPGFFNLNTITTPDIIAIIAISALVPMAGNLALGLFLGRARALLQSPQAVRRMNIGSGLLLVLVGLVIPFT